MPPVSPYLISAAIAVSVVLLSAVAFIFLWRRRRKRRSAAMLGPETFSVVFVPATKTTGTLAMVVKNVLAPTMQRTHEMSSDQSHLFYKEYRDLKSDGWVSEGSIRREFHEIGGTPCFVYTQPLRKGDQKREIENLRPEREAARLHETYRKVIENGK